MSNEITVIPQITEDQWALVKRTLMDTETVKYSDDEFKLFVNQAKRTGLDPFTRQIYATKTGGKMTVQATIDGLRLIAQRSGDYEGQTRPVWFDKDGKEYRVWPKTKGYPYACEVGVYKRGFKEPLYAIAIFDEYVAKHRDFKTKEMKIGYMWEKMPALMIAKVAEALALRKAFPNDMSGIYASEELSAVEQELKEAKPVAPPQAQQQTPIATEPPPEPTRHPNKEDILISKEQAEFMYKVGYKFGHSKDEITAYWKEATGKDHLSKLNNLEFENVLMILEQNKKAK